MKEGIIQISDPDPENDQEKCEKRELVWGIKND
jgi:hypothetical protein